MGTFLLIVLVLLLISALPAWRFNCGWGVGPAGGLARRGLIDDAPVSPLRWKMPRLQPLLAFAVSDPPTTPLEVPPNPIAPEPPAHPVMPPPSENPVPVREPPEVKPPVAAGMN